MKRIILLGPQGSGKGTQANILSERFNIPALSMGQLLRDEIAAETELGNKAASFMNDGLLVPDEVTTAVLKGRLEAEDAINGFILDGYPRFMEQYEVSKAFLNPDVVLVVNVPKEESLKRILKRAELEGRVDDTPEKIETRLTWSEEKTKPVIAEYEKQGIARMIDGVGSVEEIAARIEAALNE